VQRHISGGQALDGILDEDPDLRIFYCDSMLCTDGVTRGSFTVEDIKKIFTHYDISIVFLDYFIGRNRPTIGSRKQPNPKNPSEILSYGESTYRTSSSTRLNTAKHHRYLVHSSIPYLGGRRGLRLPFHPLHSLRTLRL
jgi:hypothetical protein